ncbi:uncharacterized protein B0T23DRAFT_370461 [Neurospora hispaniola]|uniref:Secreted protein n=1 Tax=Neurospora hispaniola TaxID=588809 RepID=A0AAJ0IGC4_9PEZI|nr:hypothetical protein B0T23DRAFT_370461 [Neurospora hispaniola]
MSWRLCLSVFFPFDVCRLTSIQGQLEYMPLKTSSTHGYQFHWHGINSLVQSCRRQGYAVKQNWARTLSPPA